jgi:SWIM zinc finger
LKGKTTMINATPEQLQEAAITAFELAEKAPKDSKRWTRAIARAWQELQSNPYLEWQDDALLILSPSNEIYRANGSCQCEAWLKGKFPCWHRAAARIVQRALETSH